MSSLSTEYFTSERFIHDDLVLEAEMGLGSLYETWAMQSRIEPFLLVWPAHPVEYRGRKTEDVVPFDLPEDRGTWHTELRRRVHEASAYGILLAEQHDDVIVVIFESQHGTKSWRIPIKDHGDVRVLGDPVELTDTDSIGVLWAPKRSCS